MFKNQFIFFVDDLVIDFLREYLSSTNYIASFIRLTLSFKSFNKTQYE